MDDVPPQNKQSNIFHFDTTQLQTLNRCSDSYVKMFTRVWVVCTLNHDLEIRSPLQDSGIRPPFPSRRLMVSF